MRVNVDTRIESGNRKTCINQFQCRSALDFMNHIPQAFIKESSCWVPQIVFTKAETVNGYDQMNMSSYDRDICD